MTAAVTAEQITYRREKSLLLREVNLVSHPGEVLGIVGPNGAGKTTLLRVLAGDLAPSSGRARVGGVDPAAVPVQELAKLRAYLRPSAASEIPFTVRDTVMMGRHPHRKAVLDGDGHDAVVEEAMARTGVDHLAHRVMASLSTGEQQMAGLARVVAQEAPVLLLDEPTSALDIGHQEQVMRLLRSLAAAGTAVIAVLHDLNLAAAHTDRLVLFDGGVSVAQGTPAEVLTGERLSAVYGQPMQITAHPYRDCPLVLTVDGSGVG